MILLKGFLRNKKTKLYIKIFVILFVIILLLNQFKDYLKFVYDKENYDTISLVLFSKENPEDFLKNEKGIKSYKRAISFEIGKDNDIIYYPQTKLNGSAEVNVGEIDETKILWNRLSINDNKIILSFPSSFCGFNLSNNEVVIAIKETEYNSKYKSNYINKEIIFKYDNEDIPLKIKEIIEPKANNYVCISDNLYQDLLSREMNYIFSIVTYTYEDLNNLADKWPDLEGKLLTSQYFNDTSISEKIYFLEKIINLFNVINILSIIIIVIIIICVIKDLLGDEENNIILLKQLGFNKIQNMINTLRNMIILDLIVIFISILLTSIVVITINLIFNFSIMFINFQVLLKLCILILSVELIFTLLTIKTLK